MKMSIRHRSSLSLVFFLWAGTALAQSFQGPTTGPGVGGGAIRVDAARNLSVGTSTPAADTRFLIVSSSTDSSAFAIKITQPGGSPLLVVRNDGSIGVATAPSSTIALNVGGDVLVGGTLSADALSGTVIGTLTAGNVTPAVFNSGTGNFSFGASLGVATSTQVSLPQELSVYGDGYFYGNVGIGTTGPGYKLDVQGGQVNASGGLCIGGNCKADWSEVGGGGLWTASSTNIYYNDGNVGIGTTGPLAGLHVVNNSESGISIQRTSAAARHINHYINASGVYNISDYGVAVRMAIDADGNVGIGDTTPTEAKLVVNGTISASTPTASDHVATKGWVEAQGGGGAAYAAAITLQGIGSAPLWRRLSRKLCLNTS